MNYYPHHIGDYAKDTAHLSMLEDAAYRRLLDVYYATEKPLPADSPKVCRLVRARSLAERKAVDAVLAEFFVLEADGWRNKRADLEIAKALEKSAKARASAEISAAVRRGEMPSRTCNSAKGPDTTDHRPLSVRSAFAQLSLSDGSAPNNQEPITKELQKHVGIAPKNGARHASIEDSPLVQTLPLREGGDFEVRQSFVAELEPLYPAVDVARTIAEMKGWLIGNPERKKTRRGIRRFITSWLQSEQEKSLGA